MKRNTSFVCLLWRPFLKLLRQISKIFETQPEDQFDHLNINISTR